MAFERKRVFELHIFKDADKTNWTKPTVHTFPLSPESFPRFNRADPYPENHTRAYVHGRSNPALPWTSRDGLLNLWRCDPQQLSFLQKHIDERNAKVKKRTRNMSEEYRKLMEEDKKKEEDEKKLFEENLKKDREAYSRDNVDATARPASTTRCRERSRGPRERSNSPASFVSDAETRRHMDNEPHIPIPPPPPGYIPASPVTINLPHGYDQVRGRATYPRYPRLDHVAVSPQFRPRPPRSDPSAYETTWTLESVELDLQPYEVVFQSNSDNIVTPYDYYAFDSLDDARPKKKKSKKASIENPWKPGSLKVSSYKVSETGKHEFAIVLSRYVAVKARPDRNRVNRHRSPSPYYYDQGRAFSNYGPISPQRSVYGEVCEDINSSSSSEEDNNNDNDNDNDEEYDHDIEVILSPKETESAVPGV